MDVDKILSRMSYHAVYDSSISDAIMFASENGFSGIQIAVDAPHFNLTCLAKEEIATMLEQSKKYGIRINLHAPDAATLVQSQQELNNAVLSYYSNLITLASKLSSSIITIHPGVPASFPTDTMPPEQRPMIDTEFYKKLFNENLEKIIRMAKGNVNICIENVNLENFAIEVLDERIKNGNLFLCWDLQKMYSKEGILNEETKEFIFRNLGSVRQVHLHSLVNGKAHRVIQRGIIDFKNYLSMLQKVDVLDYCIEVRPREKAVESLDNLGRMLQQ